MLQFIIQLSLPHMTTDNSPHSPFEKQNTMPVDTETDADLPLIAHFVAARRHLILALLGVLLVFLLLLPFNRLLFEQFASPVLLALSDDQALLIRKPLDSFLVPLKLCLFLAFVVALPWVLYQIWGFLKPGLHLNEIKFMRLFIVSTTGLFYLGILFAYFVVLPLAFAFLAHAAPEGSNYGPDIAEYFSFVLNVFIGFGLAFELPVVVTLLIYLGFVSANQLRKNRPYVIVTAFVLGMLLTPPDVISQTLLALPMWLLFEVGLWLGERLVKKRQANTD